MGVVLVEKNNYCYVLDGPKGRVPRPWPWVNEISPEGRQAKLVIDKCHGLARGYLQAETFRKGFVWRFALARLHWCGKVKNLALEEVLNEVAFRQEEVAGLKVLARLISTIKNYSGYFFKRFSNFLQTLSDVKPDSDNPIYSIYYGAHGRIWTADPLITNQRFRLRSIPTYYDLAWHIHIFKIS